MLSNLRDKKMNVEKKVDSLEAPEDVVAPLPQLLLRHVLHLPVLLQDVHPVVGSRSLLIS